MVIAKVKIYANGKLVRFVSKNSDENGTNIFYLLYIIPDRKDGESTFNYVLFI